MDNEENNEYLELLAHKYKQGTLTEVEAVYFESWYNKHHDDQLELPQGYSLNPIVIRERIHQKLKQRIRDDHKKHQPGHFQISLTWQRIIAAASVLIIIGFLVYTYFLQEPNTITPAATKISLNVAPGSNKATLMLADGTILDLNAAENGTIATQQQTSIEKTADGSIAYKYEGAKSNSSPDLSNTITTPRGGQFQITLPDGTKVWLNAASRLKYPVSFLEQKGTGKRGTRMVELSGEAYFEVAKDKAHPFIVKSGKQEVEVLGTHFNINSYENEGKIRTTLEEGSVRVSAEHRNKIIIPGEQARFEADGTITVKQADLETELAWKNGKLKFRDASIQQIMREVSRWYDIDIRYEGAIPGDLFTGGISRQSNLSSLLKIFEASQIKFHLQQNGSKRTLVIKP
ncbi:FecR family protein [Pedobacter sp. B4-66]|uniref:FecR family protein n=1 Tax=Pedobacter sp. B4-66 TaxID=2817280 RepID=UPI001BDA11B5|nr:FecR family protein [Pedobacter sp. B4-66]